MRAALFFLIGSTLAALQIAAAPLVPGLVSSSSAPTVSASGHSYLAALSADGRYVVFLSSARNLGANDTLAAYMDVFRHDLTTGETKLISNGANGDSRAPSISSNAQWIAFASAASNLLTTSDDNSGADIFLADANSLTQSLVSATPNGSVPGNSVASRNLSLSDKPQVSADGRWVAFESFATNLTSETDGNADSDVFLRDTLGNQTVLVSVALGGGATANGKSEVSGITAGGNYVLFNSTATNVAPNGLKTGYQELYLRDATLGSTTWIAHSNTYPPNFSPPAPGNFGPYNCRWAVMSRNADFVLYKVEFPSSPLARVHLYDRQNGTNIVLTTSAQVGTPVHMSSDGRFIAYDETNHVFLWDRQTMTRTQVSTNGRSHSPIVSEDGSIVAFVSAIPNLPFQIYCRNMISGEVRRLTETHGGGSSARDHYDSSIIIDPASQFILFDSAEDGLVGNDRNGASDVFLHNIGSGETRLISRAHQDSPAFTSTSRSGVTNFCLSADGNRLLFFSRDGTIAAGDTNGWSDAFLYELSAGTSRPLTTNESGLFSTNSAVHGLLSANGRFALLGLVSPGSFCEFVTAPVRIVRKDLDTGETLTIVSNPTPGSTALPFPIALFDFSISGNGQVVAYPANDNVVVVDLQTGSRTNLADSSRGPLISPDGRYVTYMKPNSEDNSLIIADLSTGQGSTISRSYQPAAAFSQNSEFVVYGTVSGPVPGIKRYSVLAGTSVIVCTNCLTPAISADGRFVVYEKAVSNLRQVELKDMVTGQTTLVTRNVTGTGGGNVETRGPVVSGDGRFVAYTTKATNLTTDVPNGWNNLYVYDRLQGTTIRVTGARGNTGYGSGSASKPVLGPDGRTLVFQSFASDFAVNDFNDTRDVFLLKLGEGDADNDGMSDSWEHTHFGNTDRDGTGDFDSDGQSDLAEYLAGTNPADGQSVLEVITITSVGTGQRQLIWRAEAGKSYRVEFKTDLQGAAWTSLGQVVTASSATASVTDSGATSEKRFYRVALVQ